MPKKNLSSKEQREYFILGCRFIDRARKIYCDGNYQVLGIDQSISSTGWTFRNGTKIKTGSIKPSTYGFSRLVNIEKKLKKLIGRRKPFIGIEGYAHNARFGRESAGEVVGVIKRFLYVNNFPLLPIAIQSLKSWMKAKTKGHIMLEIHDRYGIKITDSDAADAFVIADIVHKALFLANDIVFKDLHSAEEIRLYFKNEDYKSRKALEKLFKYQINSLMKLITNHGRFCEFFLKEIPSL